MKQAKTMHEFLDVLWNGDFNRLGDPIPEELIEKQQRIIDSEEEE